MQIKERIKQEEKRVLSTKISTPAFETSHPYLQSKEEEQRDYLSIVLFIGLAIFCVTVFYISLKSLML